MTARLGAAALIVLPCAGAAGWVITGEWRVFVVALLAGLAIVGVLGVAIGGRR